LGRERVEEKVGEGSSPRTIRSKRLYEKGFKKNTILGVLEEGGHVQNNYNFVDEEVSQ